MKYILLALITAFSATTFAATKTNVKTFTQPNDVYISEIMDVEANRLSKSRFDTAMNAFEKYAKTALEAQGWELELRRSWKDGTVNAQTWHEGKLVVIEMFGGFARYPGITSEAMKLVACHELGHTLAGPPLYSGDEMSVEGQSDYFATQDCAKSLKISAKADQTLANTLAKLNGQKLPSLKTPDTSVVSTTYEGHPHAQCRLDTYHAGRVGASRPLCWYAP